MKTLANIFFVVGLSCLLTACGGSGEDAPSGAAAAPTPVASAPAAAPVETSWCQPAKCPCTDGKEIVEEKGKLQNCKIAENATVQGVKVKGSISFNKEGVLTGFDLTEPHTFGNIECKGAGVRLYAPDKVKSCYITKPHEVAGIKCEGNLSINEDGSVHRCQLSEAMKFTNFDAPAKTWITFYDGTTLVDRFEVGGNVKDIDGHKCKGYMNYMHKNGKVRKCTLAEEETIEGKKYTASTDVCFDENGKVVECSTMTFVTI